MKVFSFVEREEEAEKSKTEKLHKKYETEPFVMKAKPIPTNVSLPLYKEMLEKNKLQSKQNIEKRKAQLMKLMCPPKRMMSSIDDFKKSRKRAMDDARIN